MDIIMVGDDVDVKEKKKKTVRGEKSREVTRGRKTQRKNQQARTVGARKPLKILPTS